MLLNYSNKFVEICKCYSSIPKILLKYVNVTQVFQKKVVEICKCYSIIPKILSKCLNVTHLFQKIC